MILKLIKGIIEGSTPRAKNSLEGAVSAKRGKDNVLLDVAHEAMRSDAEKLSGLLSASAGSIERKKKKERIKKKVKGRLDPIFEDNDDLIEEVTERVANAAEFDPFYDKMIDEE